MKHTIYRVYLLIAIMISHVPCTTLATVPPRPPQKQKPFITGILHAMQNGFEFIAPTKASKISTGFFFGTSLITLFALYLTMRNVKSSKEKIESLTSTQQGLFDDSEASSLESKGWKERALKTCGEILPYIKEEDRPKNAIGHEKELKNYSYEDIYQMLSKLDGDVLQRLETEKKNAENETLEQKKLLADAKNECSELAARIADASSKLEQEKTISEGIKKHSGEIIKKNKRQRQQLSMIPKEDLAIYQLSYNQMKEIEDDLKVDELKQQHNEQEQQEGHNTDLLQQSSMPGQAAIIYHPYFESSNDKKGNPSARYIYEIIETNDDTIVGYKVRTRKTRIEASNASKNHLIIIDQATKENCMEGNTKFEHICREKMFSNTQYMKIQPGVVYTFVIAQNEKIDLNKIQKLLPENKKDLHTIFVDGETIAQEVLTKLQDTPMWSNQTNITMAGLGDADKTWVESEEAAKILNRYNNILNLAGDTQNRFLVNKHLNKRIVNIDLQKINEENLSDEDGEFYKINPNKPFIKLLSNDVRTTAFYAVSNLYYGIFYHILPNDWKLIDSDFIYVYAPRIQGALQPYCHTDNIFTKNEQGYDELDPEKFANYVSEGFSKTSLYPRILSDRLKLNNTVGKGRIPKTRTEERMNNGAKVVKQGIEIITNGSMEVISKIRKADVKSGANWLLSYIPTPSMVLGLKDQISTFMDKNNTLDSLGDSMYIDNNNTDNEIEIHIKPNSNQNGLYPQINGKSTNGTQTTF